jgi:hypothetical protein
VTQTKKRINAAEVSRLKWAKKFAELDLAEGELITISLRQLSRSRDTLAQTGPPNSAKRKRPPH